MMHTFNVYRTVLLILIFIGVQANAAKGKEHQSLYDYSRSSCELKDGVKYLELREYTRVKKSKEPMRHTETPFVINNALLNSFHASKVKQFKKLSCLKQQNKYTKTLIKIIINTHFGTKMAQNNSTIKC